MIEWQGMPHGLRISIASPNSPLCVRVADASPREPALPLARNAVEFGKEHQWLA